MPRFFRRKGCLFGEITWNVNHGGQPKPAVGKLRYPIGYPDGDFAAFSDHGFHISGPFISDTARHGIADAAARNQSIIAQARTAFVGILRRYLLPVYGPQALSLLRRPGRPNTVAEHTLLAHALELAAFPVVRKVSRKAKLAKYTLVDRSRGDWRIIIASCTWKPKVIDRRLMRLVPAQGSLLHEDTPEFVVAGLLQLRSTNALRWRIDHYCA